jgi:hypothetical protein
MFLSKWFCKHEWKIIKDERIKTDVKLEKLTIDIAIVVFDDNKVGDYYDQGKDTQHTILQCTKCGKLNHKVLKV